jgi:hypothetical protein
MTHPKRILENLHQCLAGTPAVMHSLLVTFPGDSAFWDLRPDPDRFSPREVMAHIADWNPIFEERIVKTLTEDHPKLVDFDEERFAVERNYARQDPVANLARFISGREELIKKVRSLGASDWERAANREGYGDMTVADQVVLISIHDAYHEKEMAEYVEIWRSHS